MTESEIIKKLLSTAEAYKGAVQGDSQHKELINYWNKMSGIPGKAGYTTAWCAIYVSVVFAKAGLGKLMEPEWNVAQIRNNYIKLGRWQENENIVPEPGWVVVYNWDDGTNYATTDNKGSADHVGIVYSVSSTKKTFNVIEGNYGSNHVCGVRRMNVNGRYLRGFCKPNFASLATSGASTSSGTTYDKNGIAYAQSYLKSLAGTYKVTAKNGLNLRNAPGTGQYNGTQTKILKAMPYQSSVTCYGYYTVVSGLKWLLVKYGSLTGYCSSGYLTKK
ncbi:MAG: CHAP domain-containing protein [Lachnospiraceae bacterium]|nr:CHAP domain-containing protein [Lachnospiraceae bacterium]